MYNYIFIFSIRTIYSCSLSTFDVMHEVAMAGAMSVRGGSAGEIKVSCEATVTFPLRPSLPASHCGPSSHAVCIAHTQHKIS